MSTMHIPFQTMSDLHDADADVADERDAILGHIRSCGECAAEYARLEKTLELVRECSRGTCPSDLLLARTMKKIKFIRRKKLVFKSAPAIAASLLVISGAALYNAGLFTSGSQSVIADKAAYTSLSDSEQVIDIIRKHNATISDITQDYVEGTVSVAVFDKLRRDLGARKVAYLADEESAAFSRDWGNAIEEVGAGDIMSGEPQGHGVVVPRGTIRFRVFR